MGDLSVATILVEAAGGAGGGGAETEVLIEEICIVKPRHPRSKTTEQNDSPPDYYGTHLYLNSLDLFWRQFHYNRRLLFYRAPTTGSSCVEEVVEALKRSLSEALHYFYPLAGRLCSEEGGRSSILCEDQGVEFVVAEAAAAEVEDGQFAPASFFSKLAQMSEMDESRMNELPLLSVQVTKFGGGGISVGFAHSHVVADGYSIWHFMNSWAEICRGQPLSLLPTHDRSVFKIEAPLRHVADSLSLPPSLTEDDHHRRRPPPPPPPEFLSERLFRLSQPSIDALKRRSSDIHPISSYSAVSAHFWQHVMHARRLPDDSETVLFAVLADMRRRVTPPLPPSYFGNAIIFKHAQTTYGELRRMDAAGVASLISAAAQDCDEKRLWAKIHWLEMNGNLFGRRLLWRGSCMNVASSPKFDVYGVDFGWGRPVAVRTAKIKGDGEMVLFQSRHSAENGGGGIDVCMALEKRSMERLLANRRFRLLLPPGEAAEDDSGGGGGGGEEEEEDEVQGSNPGSSPHS